MHSVFGRSKEDVELEPVEELVILFVCKFTYHKSCQCVSVHGNCVLPYESIA